ncbi:hypothetical protein E2C01_054635 [Portunus trituberculatus]|uniref:Uncharacterized protein n=1 Tax=Portunus trituberculatus TaxID=210409 RepID=A0A5B7GSL1_PORTR|nr:hypothetical protein [Portunus trituberculatus]
MPRTDTDAVMTTITHGAPHTNDTSILAHDTPDNTHFPPLRYEDHVTRYPGTAFRNPDYIATVAALQRAPRRGTSHT